MNAISGFISYQDKSEVCNCYLQQLQQLYPNPDSTINLPIRDHSLIIDHCKQQYNIVHN
jgi:hypothetical protein